MSGKNHVTVVSGHSRGFSLVVEEGPKYATITFDVYSSCRDLSPRGMNEARRTLDEFSAGRPPDRAALAAHVTRRIVEVSRVPLDEVERLVGIFAEVLGDPKNRMPPELS